MQQLQDLQKNAQAGTTALAKTANHPIQGKVALLEQKKNLLGAGVPGYINVEREIRSATIMLANSKDLQDSTPASFYTAVSIAINTGIGLGRGMGYLVAYYDSRAGAKICQYVPGWRGLQDLVTRSGRASCWPGVVRKGDKFHYKLGARPDLEHEPGDSDEFTDITHYYAIGWVKGSDYPIIKVWSANKVAAHLDQYNKVGKRHYALKDNNNYEQYGQKVVLLQVIKYLPQSQEVANAVAADAAHESGKNAVIDGDMVWIDEQGGFDDGSGSGPLAAEIHEPEERQEQQAGQQRQAEVVDRDTGEVISAVKTETDEEADFRRSQEREAAKPQQKAAAAETPDPTSYNKSEPTSRVRRRTADSAPE